VVVKVEGNMKIVVIAGLAESLLNFRGPLLAAMKEGGHEVFALAPGENPQIAGKLRNMGVEYRATRMERTGMNPLQDIRAMLQLKTMLRTLRPNIVLSYTIKPVIYGSLAARMAGVPHVFSMITGLGYAFMGEKFKQRMVNKIVSILYHLSLAGNEKVFFQNPDDLSLFCLHKLFCATDKAVLINGSGIDLDYFVPPAEQITQPVFLLIARLLKDKGIAEYAEAAGKLKRKYPQAVFGLLGPFDSNPSAIKPADIDRWQQEGSISYLGEADDVRPYIAACTVYVLPSYREGTPRTVLEAMAMGRPIVTTDAPGCRETVVEGKNGFLVPVRDAESLAHAMEKFILDPGLIKTMGKRSRERAAEKYDVHKVNAIIMNTIGLDGEKTH
jgi:glycosyltransferase involved in cell wall biosynthesis